MKYYQLITLVCAVAGFVLHAPIKAAYIVRDGAPMAQIIVADDPPRTVAMAAQDLRDTIERITGAVLPLGTTADERIPIRIYVGPSPYTEALGLSTEGLTGAGYKIAVGEDWMAFLGLDRDYEPPHPALLERSEEAHQQLLAEWDEITGDHFGNIYHLLFRKVDHRTGLWEMDLDYAGTFNGVSNFLQGLGVRWYFPGELGEVLPDLQSIALPPAGEQIVKPDFSMRNLYIHGGNFTRGRMDDMLWRMRMGLNEGVEFGFADTPTVAHGTKWVIIRDEIKEAHPELYMIRGGEPQLERGIPNLGSDKLVERNINYLRHVFDHYGPPMVSVMPTDGFTAAGEDPISQSMVTPERGWFGGLSDYVWSYVVKVAEGIAETHPDKKIHTLAYTTFMLPPQSIDKLPPNVVVGIAYSPGALHSQFMRDFHRTLRRDWQELIGPDHKFYSYGYYLHGWRNRWPGVPAIYPRLIVDDLRDWGDVYYGAFTEVFPTPPNWINSYVTARFYWDVDQDLDAMMEEYYRLFYGPARQQMQAFIEFCEANWMHMMQNADLIEEAFRKIEAAQAAAVAHPYSERVGQFATFMQPMLERRAELLAKLENAKNIPGRKFAAAEVTIDGKLNEAIWDQLPTYSMTLARAEGAQSDIETEVKLGWAGDDLLVAVICHEPMMENVTGLTRNQDSAIFNHDSVEIMLETQTHSHYQIAVSALGGVIDVDRSETLNTLWSSGAEVAVYRGEDRWVLEARIPVVAAADGDIDILNGVLGTPPSSDNPWFINVGRLRMAGGERQVFSLSGEGFHDKLNFARFFLEEN